ncbi:hypothetical protein CCY99_05120 [Helicobacter sp. 16-1353]|uniref:LutC/YkgG family protein n=1 Tax=Helicobacter sp. 16-1353 TaxID=2004996 RepID=UPI000DCEADEF|nr:lactate utilization protein C [Helicobacter sp. 16-1353]RAX54063.1 hypothetical protein CCY99_05120 [Helicobacter sp. 16-1353]
MSKEAILLSAKNALKQNKLRGVKKDYKNLIKDSGNLEGDYVAMQSANKAIIVESSADSKAIVAKIGEILKEIEAKNVIYNLELSELDFSALSGFNIKPYEKSVDNARDELFGVDTSIVYAKCGIADVGIFGLASSPKHPRLASLITKNCIVILERKNIVKSLPEGLELLRGGVKSAESGESAKSVESGESGESAKSVESSEKLPSNLILIAGPSRTADIELQTVFGVHGPQQVYIILV